LADYTADELREALRPIASLIGKSEKARQRLRPGTWQRRMLDENLRALHLATDLMAGKPGEGPAFSRGDLEAALRALSAMIGKAEDAQAKFAPGTAQHTLQRNRIRALRIAEARVRAELGEG